MLQEERAQVLAAVEEEFESLLGAQGFELVALRYDGYRQSRTLTVFMDKPGGVTAQDCQDMSYELGVLMDVLDPIPYRYQLIVSSPGLDRPLTKPQHFQRFVGEQAAVRYAPPEGGRRQVTGRLLGFAHDQVQLQCDGEELHVPWADVEDAHLVYDWPEMEGKEPGEPH